MQRELSEPSAAAPSPKPWLNRTTLGVGLTSLLSDWAHEMATAILPAFLASLGAGPGWLGVIEGVADGVSSVSKLTAGHYTDRLRRRKPLALSGYVLTALATGAMALAGKAPHVLAARVAAWLGRGVRTPGRKALLAAAVAPEAYGRAFGFERMMDTAGAIVAPLASLWLLRQTGHDYAQVIAWTLVPGLLAVFAFALLVREETDRTVSTHSFWGGLRALPRPYNRFLLAVGVFGLGDFSHTLLILYATQTLTPAHGLAAASSIAIGLYLVHNVFYAGAAFLSGWISDRVRNRRAVLAAGYGLAAAMAALLATEPASIPLLALVFVVAGIVVGVEEALEDSVAAEMVSRSQHGMAFGSLAAVNAVGDFGSSLLVGFLWSWHSAGLAFAAAGLLFLAGTILVLRLRH